MVFFFPSDLAFEPDHLRQIVVLGLELLKVFVLPVAVEQTLATVPGHVGEHSPAILLLFLRIDADVERPKAAEDAPGPRRMAVPVRRERLVVSPRNEDRVQDIVERVGV
jgi:hypothetical protein